MPLFQTLLLLSLFLLLLFFFVTSNPFFFVSVSMDTHSTLCLGIHSNGNGSPATRTPIADDSISLQISSNCRDPSHSASSSVALQFLEQQPQHNHREEDSVTNGQEEDDEFKDDEEEFSILGHSVCLKRRRDVIKDGESSSATSTSATPSKKIMCESSLETRRVAVRAWGNQPLCVADPDINEIMEKERHRQVKGIELIASENFVCRAVMEALGSHLTNKYSEGMPGARYYGGNQYIDQIELLCCKRALEAFHLDPDKWGVNVQPYSCTSANFAVYTGLLNPKDRIMGLDTPSGGHLSHGYYTPSGKKVAAAAIYFESLPYKVNPNSGYIDYDKLEENALNYRPKILICGGSSYPREWDYARFRQIADKCGAVLMCDMAHISGLVAAKVRVLLQICPIICFSSYIDWYVIVCFSCEFW